MHFTKSAVGKSSQKERGNIFADLETSILQPTGGAVVQQVWRGGLQDGT